MAINTKYIIGVDIGGSKINVILFKNGKVLKSVKIPTPKNRKKFLKELETLVKKSISGTVSKKIAGIGCGMAGALDLERGVILNSPNLLFLNGFNIKNWFLKKFRLEIKIDNDARSFTRGEYFFGAGKGYKNIVGITLGTGIGGGIIINGKMFYGAYDAAGEIGHMIIDKEKDLEKMTVKMMRKFRFSKKADREFEKNLGVGFANIINILDPEIIIIGGGSAKVMRKFLPKVKITTAKFIISPRSQRNVKIIIGKLGESAGAIGAAALFCENKNKIYER